MLRSAPLDAADWPVRVDMDSEGRVWLAMATDVQSLGGVARYSAALDFELAWGSPGAPRDLAFAPGAEVWVGERGAVEGGERVSRFDAEGRHRSSWPVEGQVQALAGGSGVHMLTSRPLPSAPPRQVLTRHGPDGEPEQVLGELTWPYLYIDISGSETDLFVASGSDNIGAEGRVVRFGQDGRPVATWSTPGQPVAVSVDARDRVFVADMGVEAGGSSFPFRYIVYDALGQELWRCPVAGASIIDLAAGLEGDAYVLVGPQVRALRHYDATCHLVAELARFEPVQALPLPPTATPAPASPTPMTATPAPSPTSGAGTPPSARAWLPHLSHHR